MLVLTAALIAPIFIDWANFRADFEREASRVLGRQVEVKGAVTARLLPFPSVTFEDVRVDGGASGEPAMAIETFSMDAELAPLMRGELLIFDMRLVRPRATVSIAEDGTVDWAIRPSSPFDPRQVTLEKVTITEGQVIIHHAAGGRDHMLTEVNAVLSATSLAGPWRIDGSARLDGMVTRLDVSTGAVGEDGKMRVRIRAAPERYAFDLETDGHAAVAAGALSYEGTFRLTARQDDRKDRLRGADGDTFAVSADGGAKEPQPPAYRVRGSFALTHLGVEVPEFRFETGSLDDPYTADGKASIALGPDPRFRIEADGAQIRFADAVAEDEMGGGIALAARLAGLREALADLPKPVIPGSIDVNLPAIVAGDTTIRDVRLSSEPNEQGWAINTLSATLPGRATLEANGQLFTGEDDFGFSGRMVLAINQPSGFAAWLSKEVDEPIRRLSRAGFQADVVLNEHVQEFRNLHLALGDAEFSGSMVNDQPADARPSLQIDLDGGRLDVEGLAAFAALFVSDSGATRWDDRDLDLKVRAGPVVVAGIAAESLDTQLRLRDDTLEIDKLALDGLEGASISATGKVKGIGSAPVGSIDATLLSDDLGRLVGLLAERFPNNAALAALDARADAYPGLLAEANVGVVGSLVAGDGDQRQLAVSAQGKAGGSQFSLTMSGEGEPDELLEASFKVNFSATNDDPAPLYALYGLPALPFNFAEAARTELSMEGTLAEGAATRFRFEAEGLSAAFDGTVGAAEGAISAQGKASVEADDLEPWLMTAGQTLPGMGLGLPTRLAGDLDLRNGLLVISNLSGKLAGIGVSGDVNAAMRDGLPHITGAIDTDSFDLALPAESIFGTGAFAAGDGIWPQAPFEPKARPPFTADIQLTAGRLSVGSFTQAANAQMTARFDREGLRLSDLGADYRGGRLTGLIELTNNAGTGLLSAQLRLDRGDLAAMLPEAGIAGRGDFGVSVTASGKSVDGLVASLAGSGTAALSRLSVPGLNPGALPALLASADEMGTQIDAEKTADFAPALVGNGRFEAGKAELALTIAAGVVRTPPVRLEQPEAVLTVEPRIDLANGTVGATGTIEYRPSVDDRVAGAEPAVRFSAEGALGGVSVSYDTQPLAQYLTQRALEREQARVEAMQAVLLERQRLRREARYYAALRDERARLEEERRAREEAERLAAEEAARKAAEEAARRAEEEAASGDEAGPGAVEEEARQPEQDEAARRAAEEAARSPEEAQPPVQQPAPEQPATQPSAEPLTLPQRGTRAPGLPGVDVAPLAPAAPRPENQVDSNGQGTLSLDNLMKLLQSQ